MFSLSYSHHTVPYALGGESAPRLAAAVDEQPDRLLEARFMQLAAAGT
jgi:hypothetical protein